MRAWTDPLVKILIRFFWTGVVFWPMLKVLSKHLMYCLGGRRGKIRELTMLYIN